MCADGTCGGTTILCDDNNVCTNDTCDSATGCVFTPNANDCDDGDACTVGDTCTNGECAGKLKDCDDENPCTDDACLPDGSCLSSPNSAACDDDNACTQTDTCKAGACEGSDPVVCVAQDQCHDAGVCDPATGACSNPPTSDGTTCDDGNPETVNDQCKNGMCVGANCSCSGVNACCDGCLAKNEGGDCDDGDACTQTDTCKVGVCEGSNPVVCVALDQCHEEGDCDPVSGECSNPVKEDGTPCDAGEPCLEGDFCLDGICEQGSELVCECASDADCIDDGDICNGTMGCVKDPDSGIGICEQVTPEIICEDTDPDDCVDMVCIPLTGFCETKQSEPQSSCSDGDPCTINDQCDESGNCTGAQNPDCIPKPDEGGVDAVEMIPETSVEMGQDAYEAVSNDVKEIPVILQDNSIAVDMESYDSRVQDADPGFIGIKDESKKGTCSASPVSDSDSSRTALAIQMMFLMLLAFLRVFRRDSC